MLCSLSASFINITRISFAMAKNIRLKFSACSSSFDLKTIFSSFVTDVTSIHTSDPNLAVISSDVAGVSSIQSCNNAAAIVGLSSPMSSNNPATAMGCVMYGSPDARDCPSCILTAKSTALSSISICLSLYINTYLERKCAHSRSVILRASSLIFAMPR